MLASEPNNAEAIRRSLTLLEQFEESLEDVAIEDRTWSGIERNIKGLQHTLENELRKLETELLGVFTDKMVKDEYLGREHYASAAQRGDTKGG
jgi:hypothetical protein